MDYWDTPRGKRTADRFRGIVLVACALAIVGLALMILNLHEIGLVNWKVKP